MTITKTLLALGVAACLHAGAASAAVDPALWRSCNTGNASAESFAACDRLLASGELSTEQTLAATGSRALARHVLGRTDEAIADIDALVARFPEDPRAEAARALLLMYADRPTEAEASARRAIALGDTLAGPYFVLATLFGDRGDAAESLSYAAKAAALGPDFSIAQNDYCWKLAVANRELDKALAACNRAVEREPIGAHFDSRGLVHWRRGEYAKSVADYDAALARGEGEGSLYVRGLAKQALGDAAGAKADIDAALKLDPEIARTYAAWGVAPVAASDLRTAETDYAKARFRYAFEVQIYSRRVLEMDGDSEAQFRLDQMEAQIEDLEQRMEAAKARVVALGGNPDTVPRWLPPPPPPMPNRPAATAAAPAAPAATAPTSAAPAAPAATAPTSAAQARYDQAVRRLAEAREKLRQWEASRVYVPGADALLKSDVDAREKEVRAAKAALEAPSP